MKTAKSDNEIRGRRANSTQGSNWGRLIFFALALIACRTVRAHEGLFNSKTQFQGLAIPVYLDINATPAAVVRVKEITHDFQSRGFFRIGVLPLLILDGVSVEVRDASQLPAILAHSKRLLNNLRSNEAIQARDFSLYFSSQQPAVVRARQVQPEDGLRWRLQNGTLVGANSRIVHFQQGLLTVAGPKAGVLSCQTTNGPIRISLSSLIHHKSQ